MTRRKKPAASTTAVRADSWSNPNTSLGSIKDKSVGLTFSRRDRLSRETLEAAYEQNPIVARVVDRLVDDAFRNGWELCDLDAPDVDPAELMSKLDDLRVNQQLARAARWSRKYGGALVAMPVLDSGDADDPLYVERLAGKRMLPLQAVSAHDARPLETDVGFLSPTYGKTLLYQVQGLAGSSVDVHHSRVIKFEPIELPPHALLNAGYGSTGWGPSVVDRLWDALGKHGASMQHAIGMMYISSLLYMQIDGYRDKVVSNGGPEIMRDHAAAMRQALDAYGVLMLDGRDKVGNLTLTTAGAHELIDRARDYLAAAADMPREILFNESPAGLNAGQLSGPQELWFAKVSAFQEEVLTPALDRVLEIAFACWGVPATSWRIAWKPLWVRSDEAQAALALQLAQADAIYLDKAVISPEEVRKHRFEDGKTTPVELEPAVEYALDLSGEEVEAYEQSEVDEAGPAPSADPAPGDLVSPREAASTFSVPTRTITRQIQLGTLRYWGLGSHKRVSLADVHKLARGHEAPSPETAA